jgi:hypothetical protein
MIEYLTPLYLAAVSRWHFSVSLQGWGLWYANMDSTTP